MCPTRLALAQTTHRFLAGSSDSDSDDDRRVVLKSAKDKRFSELYDTTDEIRVRLGVFGWGCFSRPRRRRWGVLCV